MKIKKIVLLSMGSLSAILFQPTYAIGQGFYVGAEAGKTWQHNLTQTLQTGHVGGPAGTLTVNPDNSGVGGRIFLGGNLNSYFGLEGGYTHYAPTTYTVPANTNPPVSTGNPVGDPAITANGLDFVGKGYFNFGNSGFSVFGKAGIALMFVGQAGTLTTSYATSNGIITSNQIKTTTSSNYLRPTAGVGIGYDLSQNWQMHFSATRVFGGGGFHSVDLAALGISYHFVDKYCGQFLC